MGGQDEDERAMVLLLLLKKLIVAPWLGWCYRQVRKVVRLLSGHGLFPKRPINSSPSTSSWRWWPPPSLLQPRPAHQTRPSFRDDDDVEVVPSLLRSPSPFPYFMLVAFEGGGVTRAAMLLLAYPFLWLLMKAAPPGDLGIRCMAFITFCGLRIKTVGMVSRAVLPKFLMDDLNPRALEVLKEGQKVAVTCNRCMPSVMIEGFLKEHLALDEVLLIGAPELHAVTGGRFYSGFISFPSSSHAAKADDGRLVRKTPLFSFVKGDKELQGGTHVKRRLGDDAQEVEVDCRDESSMPAALYPIIKKPVVFHDGRLALIPTPLATLAVLLWLPMGIVLGVVRAVLAIKLPYNIGLPVNAILGVTLRVCNPPPLSPQPAGAATSHVLYACTHRTLLDPVALSTALKRPVTAVTYSLSRFSELVSPIHTVRLTRDRARDGDTMRALLLKGDLAVCPEGTTCREPFLLRFSPLFAEVTDRIVPVAVDTKVGMFYGTTATGRKWMDPLLFLMNPSPIYWVQFLDEVRADLTCGGSGGRLSSRDVANRIQTQLAEVLRFQCTNLTRKDKYMMLAGNQGLVSPTSNSKRENFRG